MSAIRAIAGLTIRAAIRSKRITCLLAVLLVVLVGVPLTIHGDGTLDGRIRIMLSYSLGLASAILGLFTLWSACGSVAQEIEDRQIHQLVTKPVHPVQIWTGKWLGILAINAAFLSLTGLMTWAFVSATIRAPDVAPADRDRVNRQILTGRIRLLPRPESVDLEVRTRLERLTREGRLPDEIGRLVAEGKIPATPSDRDIFQALQKERLGSLSAVPVGASRQWLFDIPSPYVAQNSAQQTAARSGEPSSASVRFHLSTAFHQRRPVRGVWSIGTPSSSAQFRHEPIRAMQGSNTFPIGIPLDALGPGPLVLTFENAGRETSDVAVFNLGANVEILVAETSFGANLFRGLLVVFFQLALLAALGLLASTLLSFPVAVFSATGLMVVVMLVHYFTYTLRPEVAALEHSHGSDGPGRLEQAGEHLAKALSVVIAPVMRYPVLDRLADGLQVPSDQVGKAALWLVGIYSGIAAAAGSLALRRRELALPD